MHKNMNLLNFVIQDEYLNAIFFIVLPRSWKFRYYRVALVRVNSSYKYITALQY